MLQVKYTIFNVKEIKLFYSSLTRLDQDKRNPLLNEISYDSDNSVTSWYS